MIRVALRQLNQLPQALRVELLLFLELSQAMLMEVAREPVELRLGLLRVQNGHAVVAVVLEERIVVSCLEEEKLRQVGVLTQNVRALRAGGPREDAEILRPHLLLLNNSRVMLSCDLPESCLANLVLGKEHRPCLGSQLVLTDGEPVVFVSLGDDRDDRVVGVLSAVAQLLLLVAHESVK